MSDRPKRLLVVCPSWLGDVVMATPALRLLRDRLKGAFIGGLVRPGLDELLAGTSFFDELHVDRAQGVMGPKVVASKIRPRRYDTAVLLTNSFSTALVTRLAFIPRRIGYDRDGRGLLLTERLKARKRPPPHGGYACVPAVEYYLHAAQSALEPDDPAAAAVAWPRLELGTTPTQEAAGERLLEALGLPGDVRPVILNPGANNPAKRWPAERFRALAEHLSAERGLTVLVNGAPSEAELAAEVCAGLPGVHSLPKVGVTIGSLKAVCRRARLMVTNDTGPRHIAAAFGVPTITLYGPTDPRWTTLPKPPAALGVHTHTMRVDMVADPTLPESELADDHPDRCRIDRIELDKVRSEADRLLLGDHLPHQQPNRSPVDPPAAAL